MIWRELAFALVCWVAFDAAFVVVWAYVHGAGR